MTFLFTVFAYGATGAGKTFTMLGRPDHPGVMFLTMMDLYSRIDAMKETKSCDVAVSYMEVRLHPPRPRFFIVFLYLKGRGVWGSES